MLEFRPDTDFSNPSRSVILINGGFNLAFECAEPTPMILMVHVRPERHKDFVQSEVVTLYPDVPHSIYLDGFGNKCTRLVAPAGKLSIWNRFVIADSGLPERLPYEAYQHSVAELPEEALPYLLGSRYCDTQPLMQQAWTLFGHYWEGWNRVEAILNYVHNHLQFDYQNARSDRTAFQAHAERSGVCRDFAHLAITFCRCMNIPARYCSGYLGDIGVPPDPAPMDFSAWFEIYMGGQWWTLDARHNKPRTGRILISRGRDAADVAISTAFGKAVLTEFRVITEL
jgi:transglutaminase-like putative cysteine protease